MEDGGIFWDYPPACLCGFPCRTERVVEEIQRHARGAAMTTGWAHHGHVVGIPFLNAAGTIPRLSYEQRWQEEFQARVAAGVPAETIRAIDVGDEVRRLSPPQMFGDIIIDRMDAAGEHLRGYLTTSLWGPRPRWHRRAWRRLSDAALVLTGQRFAVTRDVAFHHCPVDDDE
jgi:hypothetical protein